MEQKEFRIPENFYFHGDEISHFVYVQVPMALIKEKVFEGVSATAKLLYGLLLNRTGLSLQNGWLDEHNRTYIIYTVEQVQEDFGIGRTKACGLFAELANIGGTGVGLVKKERVLNRPSRIYVMNFKEVHAYLTGQSGRVGQTLPENDSEPAEIQVVRECEPRTSANANDGHPQTRTTDVRDREPRTFANVNDGRPQTRTTDVHDCEQRSFAAANTNYQEMNKQDLIKKEMSKQKGRNHYLINQDSGALADRMDETRDLIRENVDYYALCEDYSDSDVQKLDELIEIMVEACVLEGDIEIKGRVIPHQTVQSRFEQYDAGTMMYVLESLSKNVTEVKNVKKYLLATLFNASLTQKNHIGLSVQNGLYGEKKE